MVKSFRVPENMTSATPPQPGDIVVWASVLTPTEQPYGHVAIVSRVAGEWVEIVQQNIVYSGTKLVTEEMQLLIDAKGQSTLQGLQGGWNKNKPMGWIHALKVEKALATQIVPVERTNNNISWNLDTSAIYVYLSPSFTKTIRKNDQDEGAIVVPLFNDSRGITAFTTQAHTYCMARNAVYEIQNDPRFDPNKGVKSVDFTIKYTGSRMWIRPWGGSMSGQWIEFNDIQCGSSW